MKKYRKHYLGHHFVIITTKKLCNINRTSFILFVCLFKQDCKEQYRLHNCILLKEDDVHFATNTS